jgi:alkylation response protein AidB-like acyl-CoA dehydrogenase
VVNVGQAIMNFDLNDEQDMLRDAARRFAGEHYSFDARRRVLATEEGFSRNVWQSYADMGWLGLGLPEDVGGLDCSFVESALLMEEFGRVLALEPYASSAILCARMVDKSASPSHRGALLPPFIEGKELMALAHSEAGSRYTGGQVNCTATAAADGFILNGTKTMVYDAPSADHLLVSAQFEGDFGLFVVRRGGDGIQLTPYRLIDGTRAGDVEFRAARVPASALLVEPGRALDVLEEALDRTILAQIAEALGAMEAVLAITNSYLKQRVQFGRAIGTFQALQHRMADMFIETQEARSALYRGLAFLSTAPGERAAAISAAKVVAANAAAFVGAQGIQLHGGIGMTEEYAVGHYYKKLVVFGKRHGDVDFHASRFLQCSTA